MNVSTECKSSAKIKVRERVVAAAPAQRVSVCPRRPAPSVPPRTAQTPSVWRLMQSQCITFDNICSTRLLLCPGSQLKHEI